MTNVERLLLWVDDRLGTAHFVRHALRKAFPDHWSFMLGEINAYVFIVLVATGTFLALFFDPNSAKTVYPGSVSSARRRAGFARIQFRAGVEL